MSQVRYARQFNRPCILVTPEDALRPEALMSEAHSAGAIYDDGEDKCFVIEFDDPKRPGIQELYTEDALRRSLRSMARETAKA